MATIPVGQPPQDIAYAPDGRHIYIATVDDNAVQVFSVEDHGSSSRGSPSGKAPTSVSVSRNGRRAYVTNLNDGTVTILNLASTA